MKTTMHDDAATKAALALIASGGAATISLLAQIEAWMRVASLLAGFICSCVMIYSILSKRRRK